MAFERQMMPLKEPGRAQLTSDMAGIGMNFDARPNREANVEDTIFFASVEGMDKGDLRTISVLTMWLEEYSPRVIVDRLTSLVAKEGSNRVRAYWASIARWKKSDRRFKRMAGSYRGKKVDLLESGTDFLISKNGEDPRFASGPLRVPQKTLRRREMDVIPPAKVQKSNLFIRYRIMIGPTYRSDIWALLEMHPDLSPAEMARRVYASYPTAWHTRKDWELLDGHQ